jgi:hypothetical protein
MMLAHTRLLVPYTLPSKREADISMTSVVIPDVKTVKYKYLFISVKIISGGMAKCSSIAPFHHTAYNCHITDRL